MVETEVKIRVRLELDESDKSAIRNTAKAIKDTGTAPVTTVRTEDSGSGIFFQGREDPGIKGFEKRQTIGGGVERLRDRTSKQAIQQNNILQQIKINEERTKFIEKQQLEQEQKLRDIITNPAGFVQGQIFDFFKHSPFVTSIFQSVPILAAILAAPQSIQAFVNFLKDSRIIGVFKRDVLNERNPFLSREQQRARQIGDHAVIFSNTHGFASSNSNLTTNTLSQVRANGISDIGLRDKSGGLF